MIPEEIKNLADAFSQMPGIGPRQALRLAFFMARGKNDLKKALAKMATIKACSTCFFPQASHSNLCGICSDSKRDQSVVAIIEKETDLISIEQTKKFTGTYLVLGELQKNGLLEKSHKDRLASLKKHPNLKEIIIALSPTAYGDLNASQIEKEIAPLAKKISRLGRGLPTGGEIEFADEQTLSDALRHRD